MIIRIAAGVLLACSIAAAARRAGSLTSGGAAAAALIGSAAIAAGWSWGAALLAFFLSSTLLSRHRAAEKELRTRGIVEKGDQRDAAQVLANGGMFGAAALLSLLAPWDGWVVLAAGALAAATSDTWATEVGSLAAKPPRSIISGRELAHGASGGVTLSGTVAAVGGAALIAIVAWLMTWPGAAIGGAFIGGLAGSTADSLLGATLQARRRCLSCRSFTERERHVCGAVTRPAGGVQWLDNDRINALGALTGAIVAGLWL